MKIIISTESYYPTISGVAVFSRYLALGLVERGHEVHVICPSTRFETFDEKDEGILVHRIRAVKNPFRPKLKVSFLPKGDVWRIMNKINPDIVHIQDPTSICTQVLKYCNSHHIPVVATNHFSFEYVLSYLPWLKPLHPMLANILESHLIKFYNKCNFLTFPSETIMEQFNCKKIHTKSVAISNGVNLDQFFPSFNVDEIRLKYHLPLNPIIIHVGRLDQDKSADIIIKGFSKVNPKTGAHLLMIGDGNDLKKLKKLAEKLKVGHSTTFTGFVGHGELPQLYQLSTAFTTASTIETQGIVALEAMASGLPLVVPKAGALPELVEEGVNGYLFKADDAESMGIKLNKIIEDLSRAKKMGEKSLEMVESHEVKKCYDRFENIYKDLLKTND